MNATGAVRGHPSLDRAQPPGDTASCWSLDCPGGWQWVGQGGMQSWPSACRLTLTASLGGCSWLGGEPVARGSVC